MAIADFFNPAARGGLNPTKAFAQGQAIGQSGVEQNLIQQIQQNQQQGFGGILGGESRQAQLAGGNQQALNELRLLNPTKAKVFDDISEEREVALFQDARTVNTFLKANQPEQALNFLSGRLADVERLGGDSRDTAEIAGLIAQGNIPGAIELLDLTDQLAVQQGILVDPIDREIKAAKLKTTLAGGAESADIRGFKKLMKIANLSSKEEKEAARVKLRLSPGAVGSSAQTISADQQLTEDVSRSQAAIDAAKETAKLGAQLKLKPAIQRATTLATAEANLIADDNKVAKSNEKALNVYDVGIKSLADSLSKTTTGPFIGKMPALTSSAQSAEGAIAIMAPLLKKIFREAGEGSFSDADQALLVAMIPSRTDRPAAVKFKLNTIDLVIKAKLGPQTTGQQPATTTVQETTNQPVIGQPVTGSNEFTSPSGIKFTVDN